MAAEVASTDTVPSHGSVHDYSYGKDGYPVNGQEPMNAFSPKPRTSHDSFAPYSKPSQKQSHGTGKPSSRTSSRSRTRSRQDSAAPDQNYLLPNRADALGKREKSLSRANSEADSLLDLYGRDSANRSATSVMESIEASSKTDKKQPQQGGFGSENAYWIHRDKLAKIESEELQQMGIHIPPSAISGGSKHSRGRTRSRDSHSHATNGSVDTTDDQHQWPPMGEEKRQWVPSSSPIEGTEEADEDGPAAFADPRLPEEIAADPYESSGAQEVYRMPVLRKSSSKIPVLSSTRLPLPDDAVDRPPPSVRSRKNTANSGDAKPRSQEATESAAHGDYGTESESTRPAASETKTTPPRQSETRPTSDSAPPSESASPVKASGKPGSATRKTSNPPNNRRPAAGSRTKSTSNGNTTPNNNNSTSAGASNNNNKRPTTRSGEQRPSTSHNRPEGDPPWLATMYKPDPRLPPDQQMLPTHARKLAEEQWEREGPPGADKEASSPLSGRGEKANAHNNLNFDNKPSASPTLELKPFAPERKLTPEPNRPGTSGTDRVYKTIPTIQPTTSATATSSRPRPSEVQEIPPSKEKSCACCVVM